MSRRTRYIKMKFTHDEWLKQREFGIGASESAAAIGLNKYESPYKLWRKKMHLDPSVVETPAMIQGHIQEPYIAKLFNEELGYEVIRNSEGDWLAIDPKYPFLRVSPDWLYWAGEKKNESGKEVLECKSSLTNDREPNCIKDECIYWFVQVQYQMYVLGYKYCHLGFLNIPTNHHWFQGIPYNEDFAVNHIVKPLMEIWKNNYEPALKLIADWKPKMNADGTYIFTSSQYEILHEFAPALTDGDDVVIRHPHQEEGKSVDGRKIFFSPEECNRLGMSLVDPSLETLIAKYKENTSKMKELDDNNKTIADLLKVKMDDAESIEIDGAVVATFKQNKSSMKFDTKRFQAENKNTYDAYLVETPGARILKVK